MANDPSVETAVTASMAALLAARGGEVGRDAVTSLALPDDQKQEYMRLISDVADAQKAGTLSVEHAARADALAAKLKGVVIEPDLVEPPPPATSATEQRRPSGVMTDSDAARSMVGVEPADISIEPPSFWDFAAMSAKSAGLDTAARLTAWGTVDGVAETAAGERWMNHVTPDMHPEIVGDRAIPFVQGRSVSEMEYIVRKYDVDKLADELRQLNPGMSPVVAGFVGSIGEMFVDPITLTEMALSGGMASWALKGIPLLQKLSIAAERVGPKTLGAFQEGVHGFTFGATSVALKATEAEVLPGRPKVTAVDAAEEVAITTALGGAFGFLRGLFFPGVKRQPEATTALTVRTEPVAGEPAAPQPKDLPSGPGVVDLTKQADGTYAPAEPTPVRPVEAVVVEPVAPRPAPAKPAPAKPAPAKPAPAKPAPAKPAPAKPAPVSAITKLPKDLAGAKPRYNIGTTSYLPQFESDIDRALFITSQAKPSKRDADYRKFLKGLGYSDAQIEIGGRTVRNAIKAEALANPDGGPITIEAISSLNVPDEPVAAVANEVTAFLNAADALRVAAEGNAALNALRPTPKDIMVGYEAIKQGIPPMEALDALKVVETMDETVGFPINSAKPPTPISETELRAAKSKVDAIAKELGIEQQPMQTVKLVDIPIAPNQYSFYEPGQSNVAAPNAARIAELYRDAPPTILGYRTTAEDANGRSYNLRWAVIEADEAIVSHNLDFSVNPMLPPEKQPRDRDRVALRQQVADMARNLSYPKLLRDSATVSNGAPVLNPNREVIAGNGRFLSILTARRDHPEVFLGYKQELNRMASRHGIAPESFAHLESPVLVRVYEDAAPDSVLIRTANEGETAQYSMSEQAKIDADTMTADDVALFVATEGTIKDSITHRANVPFLQRFRQRNVSAAARNLFDDKTTGAITKAGIERVTAAIFEKAYGNSQMTEGAFESASPDLQRVTSGFLAAAPKVMEIEASIAVHLYPPEISVRNALKAGLNRYKEFKDWQSGKGGKVPLSFAQFAEQPKLFPEDTLVKDLVARGIDENAGSMQRIRDWIKGYTVAVKEQASAARNVGLFGEASQPLSGVELLTNHAVAVESQLDGVLRVVEQKSPFEGGPVIDGHRTTPESATELMPISEEGMQREMAAIRAGVEADPTLAKEAKEEILEADKFFQSIIKKGSKECGNG